MRPTNEFLEEATALHSEGRRRCVACLTVFDESNFSKFKKGRYGLAGRCKPCINEQNRRYYHENKDPEQVRVKSLRQYYKDDPLTRSRKNWISCIKSKYGLTPESWGQMLIDRQGRCDICNQPMIGAKNVHVDHCHEQGHIRGMLCSPCNIGLGSFRDRPERLRAAAEYLEQPC